ncbi:MAG: menaquinol oxidoreductase [Nitrospinae bacterium RIFCSPLOWO2_12_39_16]|nr:MAG: menaquinol oxidoreductase [Nitrospinae bacterium RIFCSPLOWO2_02_39_17]OGW08697.1 MAG: menaquinol oxidoreductase [Nitrospinae bacterium RIFCSPLOWO2_12_39_16]HLA48079.1 NrfD/PsrC family molybdoenzyme membrane anchor subunit [Nitrospinota bacterium]
MFEKALSGDRRYWGWIFFLLLIMGTGFIFYIKQLNYGLGITGMSRDISWGLYIAQFTFLVGVAASAVMLVIPYYLHDYKKFGKIIIFGEFLAISAVIMCLMFVFVDMGQPMRAMNMILYPTPNSIMFWDMVVLNGYLLLNLIIGWTTLSAERNELPPPKWVKPLIYISIPWAISIHTVTAFLYAGLPGRHLWLTAIMAPRFLASAFASGPALLIILCLTVKRISSFDPGKEAIQTLGKIVTYAVIINLFFFVLELFTAFYSKIPGHMHPFQYLFFGIEGHGKLIPWMWTAFILSIMAIILLINPNMRENENILIVSAVLVFISTWIDKGMGLVIGGFIPNPFEEIIEYSPTVPEVLITLGVWATGLLIITVLYKIAVSIKEKTV